MRRLLPQPDDDVDPVAMYAVAREAPEERPWVLVNMIASLDGATAVDGASAPLGGPGDRAVFRVLRGIADVILVGAGTARAEHYRAPKVAEELRSHRRRNRQADVPRLAILSGGLELDADVPALDADGPHRPIVVTSRDAPADRRRALDRRAEIVSCGASSVDLTSALTLLRRRFGARVVLCEGGPSLNGALLNLDLLDEVCLTVAPALAGGDSRRITHGGTPRLTRLELAHVLEDDGYLFLRHVRPPR